MCFALQGDCTTKNGQLAHLDRVSNNNAPENLAYLCLAHHDDYDTDRRQTRNYTAGEVKRYQALLLKAIKSGIAPRGVHSDGVSLRLACYLAVAKARPRGGNAAGHMPGRDAPVVARQSPRYHTFCLEIR